MWERIAPVFLKLGLEYVTSEVFVMGEAMEDIPWLFDPD